MSDGIGDYQKIIIPEAKIEALVTFLINIAEGPAEAIGMLHAAIHAIDQINGAPRSPEQLGQELTTCLLLQQRQMQ